jgi:hypothetical protein
MTEAMLAVDAYCQQVNKIAEMADKPCPSASMH